MSRILLVEDNQDHIDLTLRALREGRLANDVVVARDGVEALEHFAMPELPAVVLLDLKIPKLDGLEVLKQLRADERTRLLPVVVLTSSDEQKDIVESYWHGANSYVRKPVTFAQFAQAIQQLGLYWLVLNRPSSSETVPR
ncbi:MAG: response regulator [Acidobacteria bacterium]|nr:response regulator [Acidobacteriota bacterium]